MKRFLLLLMLTGLLFGQDVLNLKSGESYKGTFFGKVDEDIVFKVEGETSTKKFSINDVRTIETSNGMLSYPFGINPLLIEAKAKELQEAAEKSAEEAAKKLAEQKAAAALAAEQAQIVLTVVGGLSSSSLVQTINPLNINSSREIDNISGYNLAVEKSFGTSRFGVGLNQRSVKMNNVYEMGVLIPTSIAIEVEENLNYLTLHAVNTLIITEKITVFGGAQLGKTLGGEVKMKGSTSVWGVTLGNESVDIDAEDMDLEYGLFLGGDYMINKKIGVRASYFKGLSELNFEESTSYEEKTTTKNNTMSVSLIFSLRK